MGKCGVWVDVEDWESILAILHSTLHEDDGQEVDTGGVQEWQRGGFGEVADVDDGDVADDVLGVVDDGER